MDTESFIELSMCFGGLLVAILYLRPLLITICFGLPQSVLEYRRNRIQVGGVKIHFAQLLRALLIPGLLFYLISLNYPDTISMIVLNKYFWLGIVIGTFGVLGYLILSYTARGRILHKFQSSISRYKIRRYSCP